MKSALSILPGRAYCRGRRRVAELVRAIIAFPAIIVVDEPLMLRALEVYEVEPIDFAEAYLVASAEASGVETIASFDRTIDRITTIRRRTVLTRRSADPHGLQSRAPNRGHSIA